MRLCDYAHVATCRTSTSIGDSTIDGLRPWKYDNSAVPNPQDISGRHGPRPNPHFGVFQRLYEEAFKEPNHAEKVWEKKVKVRAVTFSFLCPLSEKYGTFIARCNALIEKVSTCVVQSHRAAVGAQLWQQEHEDRLIRRLRVTAAPSPERR
eukprot:SAG31_NODE_918_length_11020_cov_14.801392_11_plen_151_part_00